jgi:hypothetical protein
VAKKYYGVKDPKGKLMTAKRLGGSSQFFAKKETAKKYRNKFNEATDSITEKTALAGHGYTVTFGPDHWKTIELNTKVKEAEEG